MKKIRLGELLLERGLATPEQLEQAYQTQKQTGEKLGRTLIELGVIDERTLLTLLATQLNITYISLDDYEIDPELALNLPETYARRYRAIILSETNGTYLVGLADPLDLYAIDELRQILKMPFKMAVVSETALLGVMDKIYRHTKEITHFAEELSGELTDQVEVSTLFGASMEAEDAPVVKLLLSLFKDAVSAGASDIHVEPDDNKLRIRLRVDGILQENILDDLRIAKPLIQRLKMRAQLDISEKRLPQDGRFHIVIDGKSFDIRVSTMPTVYGEAMVMRLLDQSSPVHDLSMLGMPEDVAVRIKKVYQAPHGLLLVTGPTGSGKTTTLYSILSKLNKAEKKIITVEDPVEYRLPRINQVQVNPKIHLDFAKVLRTAMRQDPDIIMVGEIRDAETATIAMRAAVTGHFVMATLHTNDAMSSALRLIDMGGKGYMVASSLKGILAQRLVRKLCTKCAESHKASIEELAWLGEESEQSIETKQAQGCSHCSFTGYKGRIGLYEFLEINEEMREPLRKNDPQGFALAVQAHHNFVPLRQRVTQLARQGLTSIAEAVRIVGELND